MKRQAAVATVAMAGVLLLLSVIRAWADSESELAAFKATRERYAGAVSSGNADAVVALWDEAGVRMPPNAPALVGKAAVRAAFAKQFAAYTLEMVTIPDDIVLSGDYAIVRGHYTVTMRPKAGGVPVYTDAKNLTIWKKQADGNWRLYRDCFNSNVP